MHSMVHAVHILTLVFYFCCRLRIMAKMSCAFCVAFGGAIGAAAASAASSSQGAASAAGTGVAVRATGAGAAGVAASSVLLP
jgi:hypothetical protein